MLDRRESMLCVLKRVLLRFGVIGLVLVTGTVVEDVTDEDDELYNVRMRLGSSATRSLVTVDVDVAVDGMDQLTRQVFAATRCSFVTGTSRE